MPSPSALDLFHPVVAEWFSGAFPAPTRPQHLGWPAIARGDSTLILAPTGTGKTLTAFLWCLNRLLFEPPPARDRRCRVLYISPLKALAVDVERNLREPLAGIAEVAQVRGVAVTVPEIAIRTGDTPSDERARFLRAPADILITTPESLFLLLTSRARDRLSSVDTVIVDEIHALVPGKRGAHLALSLERLEALRAGPPGTLAAGGTQRIGLSATQRPLEEVARFLAGAKARPRSRARAARTRETPGDESLGAQIDGEFVDDRTPATYRPVTVIKAVSRKQLSLRVEMEHGRSERSNEPNVSNVSNDRSQWASIHPRLLELIRSHRSTLLFVNNRRLAERLAAALNDLADEPLARAHHGSLAHQTRREVEDLLKAGRIRALVATSSLELGIDMGAIDLVVQIEAPPSVASGLQRIGRAGHQVDATSEGVIFPKFRGDLLACAAVTRAMHEGRVEATRYPRNPLDVLAQQIVAMAAMDTWATDDLFATVRRAAPFADLRRAIFDGVLDMLSGRYPSDEFAELRPRIVWNRARGTIAGRQGAARVVIANAGTIPDRGLYGVFLAGADRPVRVGELDEEMVFETPVGDTFTLGASTWRVEEITHDRVLVSPAPGEPGKMPFWHGDQAGRPVELGRAIGALVRELRDAPRPAALDRLTRQHDLDTAAAEHLMGYLDEQAKAGAVPDDRSIVIERCLDDLGDWRVCLLSPLGSRVHAPWAMAVVAQVRARTGLDVEVMWGDEGFVVRFPEVETPPDPSLLLPDPSEVDGLVRRQLGSSSLFAARFRETAARALLLPRRRPGQRTPLWRQRKRAADLLAVAARFGSFPALLETYRELLRDQFDMPALVSTLRRVSSRAMRVHAIDSTKPSPFAASLLFSYVANYIYDGDTPLAERRAQALSVDRAQLRELIGDAELRDLLDPAAIETTERQLQHLDERYRVRHADGLHDLLLRIGDLTAGELEARSAMPDTPAAILALQGAGRIVTVSIAREARWIAVEDAARYRDALGVALPSLLPAALLDPVRDPAGDLVRRFARSRGPFAGADLAARFGLATETVDAILRRLAADDRLVEGEFTPGGSAREWIDAEVLRQVRQRSLAKLRREVEPVETAALGRFSLAWHGIGSRRAGLDALLDAVEQLQGAAVPASVVDAQILPARVDGYEPAMLDTLMAAGEIAWVGVEPIGEHDGRVAFYLTDQLATLRPSAHEGGAAPASGRAGDIAAYLRQHGASFFAAIHQGTGGGFPQDTVEALWTLVWRGIATNDTLHPLRAYTRPAETRRRRRGDTFRSRRLVPPTAEGRWTLVGGGVSSTTEWAAATARQLLTRHGVVTRETVAAEAVAGGFTAVYEALKAMEAAGRVRRGYFVAGLGGAQFAMPAALELLRDAREPEDDPSAAAIAATDPANPYGSIARWPESGVRTPARTAGATALIVDGLAGGYLGRGERELRLFAPEHEPGRSRVTRAVARLLLRIAHARDEARRGMLIADINGEAAVTHVLAHLFVDEGFTATAMGLQARPDRRR